MGYSALQLCCLNGHNEIAIYLMSEKDANPILQDKLGNTPIHTACIGGHLLVVMTFSFIVSLNDMNLRNKVKFLMYFVVWYERHFPFIGRLYSSSSCLYEGEYSNR
jgi:ankyrin repeat protein